MRGTCCTTDGCARWEVTSETSSDMSGNGARDPEGLGHAGLELGCPSARVTCNAIVTLTTL